jgi:hypothetical protein
MSDDLKCKYCFGTGQKIEMTAQKFGQKLPPISPARVVEAPASAQAGQGLARARAKGTKLGRRLRIRMLPNKPRGIPRVDDCVVNLNLVDGPRR